MHFLSQKKVLETKRYPPKYLIKVQQHPPTPPSMNIEGNYMRKILGEWIQVKFLGDMKMA